MSSCVKECSDTPGTARREKVTICCLEVSSAKSHMFGYFYGQPGCNVPTITLAATDAPPPADIRRAKLDWVTRKEKIWHF